MAISASGKHNLCLWGKNIFAGRVVRLHSKCEFPLRFIYIKNVQNYNWNWFE